MTVATYQTGFAPRDGVPLYPSLWKGCVGAWSMGLGPSGDMLADWSGRNLPGDWFAGTPPVFVVDDGSWAVDHSSMNHYYRRADSATLGAYDFGSGDFAISVWARMFSSASGNHKLYAKKTSNGTDAGWGMFYNDGFGVGRLYFVVADGATRQLNVSAASSKVNDGIWRHYVCQRNSGFWQAFIDAESVVEVADTIGSLDNTAAFNMGWDWEGTADDYRIYNRALTPNEIALLATERNVAYRMAPRRVSYTLQAAAANTVPYYYYYRSMQGEALGV